MVEFLKRDRGTGAFAECQLPTDANLALGPRRSNGEVHGSTSDVLIQKDPVVLRGFIHICTYTDLSFLVDAKVVVNESR